MKLQQVQSTFGDGAKYGFAQTINANFDDQRRQVANNGGGGFGRNVTRAFLMENKAKGIRAALSSQQGVRQIGDATDFDHNRHKAGTSFHTNTPRQGPTRTWPIRSKPAQHQLQAPAERQLQGPPHLLHPSPSQKSYASQKSDQRSRPFLPGSSAQSEILWKHTIKLRAGKERHIFR